MGLILGSGSVKPQYPYDQWYGVEGDYTSTDNLLKRVGNLDLHRALPIQNKIRRFIENADGSVNYYLHQNDSRLSESGATANLDTTDGNVMLEIPEYYVKVEFSGTKWLYAISEYPLPGFKKAERMVISPWYATIDSETDTAVSGCFLKWDGDEIARTPEGIVMLTDNSARYRGGYGSSDANKDGTYNSQLGMGRTAISKAGTRQKCKNGTHLGAYRAYSKIAWLQRIEYANLNCQATYTPTITEDGFHQGGLGVGCSVNSTEWNNWGGYRPFVPNGVTATLGNNTGKVSYTVKNWEGSDKVIEVTSYRGFEVPYEYLYMLADDVLIWHKEDKSVAYLCQDPSKFTSHSDQAITAPEGYKPVADLPRRDGYIITLNLTADGIDFPKTTGGNLGVKDYYYTPVDDQTPSYGWFGALLSASATSGSYAGFGYRLTSNRSSVALAHGGFRLCRY